MCLRFVFLLITRVAAGLRLSRREEMWKTAEILILRHQISVLQRRQPRRPKLHGADRALPAALPGVIPEARRPQLRLLITRTRSCAGTPTLPAADPAQHPGTGPAAGPREPRLGVPQDPRRAGRTRHEGRRVYRVGDPQGQRHRPRPAADRAGLVTILRSQSGAILARLSSPPACPAARRPASWP